MKDRQRKIGRPKKAPAEQRSERLSGIRLTAAERVTVEAEAAKAGLPLAEFCRRAILRKRITPPRSEADAAALIAVNRIGVNLNQIAARVNMTGQLADDFRDVLAEIDTAIDRLTGGGVE
jgi:hypothetical protein